jgi:hypothetical protein
VFYVQNTAESVKCGPKQFPTLYAMLSEACEILHVPEPELYVRYSPTYNAHTAGINRTFITLQSALVDAFTDEELMFVIGHEVGHIKAGHVLYQMLGRMLLPLLETVGQMTLGLGQLAGIGLVSAFYEWMRQAEFSCDRAGLLACQNPRAAFTALMKLGGGHHRFSEETNVEAFLEQARNHSENVGLEGVAKALLFVMYSWQLDHPQVIFRAKGLDEWLQSGAYERVLCGEYRRDATGGEQLGGKVHCSRCRITLSATAKHCPKCGERLNVSNGQPRAAAGPACARCAAPLPRDARFCLHCGTAAGQVPSAAAA